MAETHKKKLSTTAKSLIALGIIVILALGGTLFSYYLRYFGSNVTGQEKYLYIRTGDKFTDVFNTIKEKNMLKDTTTFLWSAQNMDYTGKVKPGRYRLKAGMSNRSLINMLKSGNQEPVKLRFQNVRLKEDLAGIVSKQLEADSATLVHLLDSAAFVSQYGFTTDNAFAMFIPNSYEVYWNTPADKFIKRMHDEYEKFWTAERLSKAKAIDLTPAEVITLAAITDAEALMDSDLPIVAGLYINRLRKGMKLDADPTVIYANNDFTIHRVLNKHLLKDSPYNTYMYAGLPPGPIMMPSVHAIDAVLNYTHHNYLFMCAKEDFSGYHNFAATRAEHEVNARKFQQALNERNILR